jgi:hypothetical protein
MLGQIKPSFINSTPFADLAPLSGPCGCVYLVWELLEPSTLDARRFLFQLPELLSRWRDQASLGFARSAA